MTKATVSLIGNSRGHKHGDEVEVDQATADRLVRDGHARLVEKPAGKKSD